MAIKGLQRIGQTPGLARAGVIRLGYKARKCACGRITEPLDTGPACPACGKTLPDTSFPREAPHFILTDAPGVAEALGTNAPTELNVYFPFDEVDRVFPSYMHLWATSALRCRGDGEHILYAINPTTGRVTVKDGVVQEAFTEDKRDFQPGEVLACPGLERNLYTKCAHCKPNAMLVIMLRDVPRLAYYQISTTSIHNIIDLTDQLEYVREQVRKLTGEPRIAGVPFILRRVEKTISAPKTDRQGNQTGRQRVKKYFLELEIEPEWIARMVRGISRLADPLRGAALSLPAPEALPAVVPMTAIPASHYTDPPQWEPRPDDTDDVTEGDWWAADDTTEAATQRDAAIERNQAEAAGQVVDTNLPLQITNGTGWPKLDDFLFQLSLDFKLSETNAKAKLRELGFASWPGNGAAAPASIKMYLAVRDSLSQSKPVQDEIPF